MTLESEQILKEEPAPGVYVKRRYVFAVLQFFASVNVLTVRNSFSIAIVAMVNQSEPVDDINDVSNQTGVCPDLDEGSSGNAASNGVFNWNSAEQGLVLGCYFYGYMLSNVLGAWLSKKLGMKWVVAVAMLVSSILTACIPPAAYFSFDFLIAIRVLTGLFQGVVTPSLMGAWGVWAPPAERGALVTIFLSGGSVGIFLTLMVGGVMSDEFGWESVFYMTAGGMLLWTVAWAFLAFESPDVHPRISEQEKRYIINSTQTLTEEKDKGEKQNVPWKSILTSPAIYAFFVGMFANNWGNYTLQTMLPTYLSTVLRFDLTKGGILASLPYIVKWIVELVAGYLTDITRRKLNVSTLLVRKVNTVIGLLPPAVFVVLAGYVGCDVTMAVAFFVLSIGLNGFTSPGCLSNAVDISPRFAGILHGLSVTIGNTPGFLAPQIIGLILLDDNSIKQWQIVFWIAAAINLFGIAFYLIFAAGSEQDWAKPKTEKRKRQKQQRIRQCCIR